MLRDVGYVLDKLDGMRAKRIWPTGLRYLWTDAFGLVLYVSLEQLWERVLPHRDALTRPSVVAALFY
jgi:hypothetical protein